MDWWYAGVGIYFFIGFELGILVAIYFYINSEGLRRMIAEKYPETGRFFMWLVVSMICGVIIVFWPFILAILVVRHMFCDKRCKEA
ncbi:MAG: hypothetical protein Q8L11_04040 [Candidatus Moranbacteria bacterium]|nr:hypothetical protein [Candidatus Moranbacteria bacterium]